MPTYQIDEGPVDWLARIAALDNDPRMQEIFPLAWPTLQFCLHELAARLDQPVAGGPWTADFSLRVLFNEIATIDALAKRNLPLSTLDLIPGTRPS